jgi:hypothetical protein
MSLHAIVSPAGTLQLSFGDFVAGFALVEGAVISLHTFGEFQYQYCEQKLPFHLPSSGNTVLKVHKIEIFFVFDFEICIISLLVMSKY